MQGVTMGFARSAAPRRSEGEDALRHALRALCDVLDRLVPPASESPRDAELPPEWFKYPPI